MSLIGAILYCNWLSKQEGLSPSYIDTGQRTKVKLADGKEMETNIWRLEPEAGGYRLPTEEEWEYACRAGSKRLYSFGDAEALLGRYGCFGGNSMQRTSAAATWLPNAWGLFDMHGNVWEWCWNGTWGDGGLCLRGGGWNRFPSHVVCSTRNTHPPVDGDDVIGFRVARSRSPLANRATAQRSHSPMFLKQCLTRQ